MFSRAIDFTGIAKVSIDFKRLVYGIKLNDFFFKSQSSSCNILLQHISWNKII